MNIILGGTGHIGSALANRLLQMNEEVMIISHKPDKADHWRKKGAAFEIADIMDSDGLHNLFKKGKRLFILNPPASPSTDTVAEERKTILSVIRAIDNLSLEKIVAESTYGAQPGDRLGDLGVLYQMEQALGLLNQPVAIIRGAYYMSNWAASVDIVKKQGELPTLYPADFKMPMVAPEDIGHFAAGLLLSDRTGLHFIEGPQRYSANDVAAAFGKALQKIVKAVPIPEKDWEDSLKKTGFSAPAAEYMANMTRITLKAVYEINDPELGETTLESYIRQLV